jgi:site-specific DNA recombinase
MPPDITKTLRVVLYARVSSEEQREGQTIDSQVAELEHFAGTKGWDITRIYKDDGWSGSMLVRPELDCLRDDASKGLFDAVLINDVDRLARDVSHLGIIKRDLERHTVDVVFRKLPAEKSPTYNLMVNILGSFAEFEREMIIDRTRRGRRHKVEVRKQYLGSNAPYGFHYVPKDKTSGKEGYLKLAAEEAAVVRQMFEWVDKEGLSARKVVDRLNKMKVQPHKGGVSWAKSSVLRILRTETYVGVWHYNKYESCEPKNSGKGNKYKRLLKCSLRKRDKSEWLPITLSDHLKIIEREQWERVQQQLDRNITFSPRNAKHEYLLKGLVKCGGCGSRYVGDPCRGTFYYRCMARCKTYSTVREEILDLVVWEAIKEAILNPSIITSQLARLYHRRAENTEQLKKEGDDIDGLLEGLKKEEERILEAYRMSVLSPIQLAKELEKLQGRKNLLESRKVRPSDSENQMESGSIRRSLTDYCKFAAERLETFDRLEQQQFLRTLVDEIVFEGMQIRIRGVIPISEAKDKMGSNISASGNRIMDTASYSHDRSSVRIENTTANRRDHNSGRTEGIRGYRHGHNSVTEVPFQISEDLPQQSVPLKQQIDAVYLRALIKRDPSCTLKQLCDWVREERRISMSTTAMCRLVKDHNLQRRRSHRPPVYPSRSLALAA